MYSPCHIIQLALQKKFVMEFFFYVLKYRFSIIPKCLFRWNYPCNAAHLHFFSWCFFAANFFLMLGGCYCRLPARMFIWLVVESISIWCVLYFTWYASTFFEGRFLHYIFFTQILFSAEFFSAISWHTALKLHITQVDSILKCVTEAFYWNSI